MSKTQHYSLNREYSDRGGVIMSTSSLGGVIGFGTAFSSLIEPGTMPDFSWSLVQSLTLISFMGVGLGASIGLAISAYFAASVYKRYAKRPVALSVSRSAADQGIGEKGLVTAKRKGLFEVGDVVYGT